MATIIVLAAGASKRLGRSKQLLQFQGETLVARAARIAEEAATTIIVIPADEAIRAATKGFHVVENAERDEGVASSIRAGLAATTGDILLMTCDQPLITGAHLQALLDAGSSIAATGYNGISGVPAFFAEKFREELLALRGDVGAKRVIEQHRNELVTIPFEGAALDVDTEAEYNFAPIQRS